MTRYVTLVVMTTLLYSCAYTPSIKGDNAVASMEQVKLGGVKQTVLIRGQDMQNPVLLFLHGGYGMPMMFLAHTFQRLLEKDFVVVQWDRRGAGKSYRRNVAPETINDKQFYNDVLELIDLLRVRFGKDKIYLAGHSWGTYLGSLLAYTQPELFYAYVGIGQVVHTPKAEQLQEAFIIETAKQTGRAEAIEDLKNYGTAAHEKWLFKFGGQLHGDTTYKAFIREGIRSPEYTLFDALKVPKGSKFCAEHFTYRLLNNPIGDTLLRYSVPCFFIAGKYDMVTPTSLAKQYYDKIDAPEKAFYLFDSSAHFPFYEESEHFARVLADIKDKTYY